MSRRIAIYGKGGIGKSTISVNLALSFAGQGLKTLLVGCDPKQDTARLLTPKPMPSILSRYTELKSGGIPAVDVVAHPRDNLWCCEAGGPKPGVGCAGRGIVIALEYLEQTGRFEDMDIILFDVLGDIVCGGFSTPITKGYAEQVYVVTSGEQASLFAANNILAGMSALGCPVGGVIQNQRGFPGEGALVERYCSEADVPLLATIAYSETIKQAELHRTAAMEWPSAGTEQAQYRALAKAVLACVGGGAKPLEAETLYTLIEQTMLAHTTSPTE